MDQSLKIYERFHVSNLMFRFENQNQKSKEKNIDDVKIEKEN